MRLRSAGAGRKRSWAGLEYGYEDEPATLAAEIPEVLQDKVSACRTMSSDYVYRCLVRICQGGPRFGEHMQTAGARCSGRLRVHPHIRRRRAGRQLRRPQRPRRMRPPPPTTTAWRLAPIATLRR